MTQNDEIRAKANELAAAIENALAAAGVNIDRPHALRLVEQFASIDPPEHDTRMYWLSMAPGGRGGARSVKPGNITLNIQKLVAALAAGVLTGVGVIQVPWTAVLGALVIWDTLYSGATVDLSEEDASVMWTLWRRRDDSDTVQHDGLLVGVNDERARHGRPPLTDHQLADALRKLKRIRAIERSSTDPARWRLREWVRVEYH